MKWFNKGMLKNKNRPGRRFEIYDLKETPDRGHPLSDPGAGHPLFHLNFLVGFEGS